VALFRRPVPRFFAWAILLVGLAVATGAAGLAWWLIALIELAAWVIVTFAERTLWRLSLATPPTWAARPEAPSTPAEPKPIDVQVEDAEPARPAAAPVTRRRMIRTARSGQASSDHVRWNVWSLERLARDNPNAEELSFLVLSLREFADSSGTLPADFDPLVRESFGDLLPS
jgi:hypothetical protein